MKSGHNVIDELLRFVSGEEVNDITIRHFWDGFSARYGIVAAIPNTDGIEILRLRTADNSTTDRDVIDAEHLYDYWIDFMIESDLNGRYYEPEPDNSEETDG